MHRHDSSAQGMTPDLVPAEFEPSMVCTLFTPASSPGAAAKYSGVFM